MASRAADWFRQARQDLEHARTSVAAGHHEWACFAAHQAAEKALKALFQSLGGEARGHSLSGLLDHIAGRRPVEAALLDAGRQLDRHYIPARYPNAYAEGAPCQYYARGDAEEAIADAEQIFQFCERQLAGS